MNAKTLAAIAIALWAGGAAFLGYRFMAGSTIEATDGRDAIVLKAGERDFVLAEMRGMLAGVQEIVAAVNAGDLDAVRKAAHKRGTAEVEAVPPEVMLKLPMAFKQLGMGTHRGFDEIALAADMDERAVLEALETNMANCVACHEAYRLEAE